MEQPPGRYETSLLPVLHGRLVGGWCSLILLLFFVGVVWVFCLFVFIYLFVVGVFFGGLGCCFVFVLFLCGVVVVLGFFGGRDGVVHFRLRLWSLCVGVAGEKKFNICIFCCVRFSAFVIKRW